MSRQLSQKVSTRSEAEQMTAESQTTQMQGQEHGQDDRISELPDHILMNILDRLELLSDAVRTCVLSKRWRHLPGLLSKIVIDVADFEPKDVTSDYTLNDLVQANASVIKATKSILAHKSQHTIDFLSIKFHLRDESAGIVRSVDNIMANREVIRAQFMIIPVTLETPVTHGLRLMTLLHAYTGVFAGLTSLWLYSVKLGKLGIPKVLSECKKLEYLSLNRCDSLVGVVLQIEHPQLCRLSIIHCAYGRIELNQLPRLTHLTCQTWLSSHDTYPLTFGHVPQLSVLILSDISTKHKKNIKLSEFLRNVVIANLDLDFQCRKIRIQPEAPKPLAPLLRNLQMLRLRLIHKRCDLSWTMFFLEAAPLLKEVNIQVCDHICGVNEKEMSMQQIQMVQEHFKRESDYLIWEAHDLKHYNLSKLMIEGFQAEEKFKGYIRQVMKAAVNLELVSLCRSQLCARCQVRSSSVAYPESEEKMDLIRTQISDQISSSARIRFGP